MQMSRRGVATLRCCEGGHHDEASEPLSADLKFTVPTEYVGIRIHVHTYMHTRMHANEPIHMHTCVHVPVHIRIHECIHIYMHACMHA